MVGCGALGCGEVSALIHHGCVFFVGVVVVATVPVAHQACCRVYCAHCVCSLLAEYLKMIALTGLGTKGAINITDDDRIEVRLCPFSSVTHVC